MPASRLADYCIGCHDGSVYIDFNNGEYGRISLVRISFDGYGCCDLEKRTIPLDQEDSEVFKEIVRCQTLDQDKMEAIVKKAVLLNQSAIWTDALEEYKLIRPI